MKMSVGRNDGIQVLKNILNRTNSSTNRLFGFKKISPLTERNAEEIVNKAAKSIMVPGPDVCVTSCTQGVQSVQIMNLISP